MQGGNLMPITLDVSGFESMLKSKAARVKAVEPKAVKAGASVLRDAVEKRAPVGPTHKLKNNIIQTEPKAGADGASYSFVGPRDVGGMSYAERLNLGGKFGKDAPYYGRMVEFGTSKMRARPFVEPAFQASKNDILRAMAEVIKGAVEGGGDV
jgi:HK97 gp10 family phage protein